MMKTGNPDEEDLVVTLARAGASGGGYTALASGGDSELESTDLAAHGPQNAWAQWDSVAWVSLKLYHTQRLGVEEELEAQLLCMLASIARKWPAQNKRKPSSTQSHALPVTCQSIQCNVI